jgi:hypothetical protein
MEKNRKIIWIVIISSLLVSGYYFFRLKLSVRKDTLIIPYVTEKTIEQELVAGVNTIALKCVDQNIDMETLSIHYTKTPGHIEILELITLPEYGLGWRIFSANPGKAVFKVSFVKFQR